LAAPLGFASAQMPVAEARSDLASAVATSARVIGATRGVLGALEDVYSRWSTAEPWRGVVLDRLGSRHEAASEPVHETTSRPSAVAVEDYYSDIGRSHRPQIMAHGGFSIDLVRVGMRSSSRPVNTAGTDDLRILAECRPCALLGGEAQWSVATTCSEPEAGRPTAIRFLVAEGRDMTGGAA
jgi:hypothetical protein